MNENVILLWASMHIENIVPVEICLPYLSQITILTTASSK